MAIAIASGRRAVTVELRIPKLRNGCYLPGFLEPPLIVLVEIRRAFLSTDIRNCPLGDTKNCPGIDQSFL
jgi:hypothetical protein